MSNPRRVSRAVPHAWHLRRGILGIWRNLRANVPAVANPKSSASWRGFSGHRWIVWLDRARHHCSGPCRQRDPLLWHCPGSRYRSHRPWVCRRCCRWATHRLGLGSGSGSGCWHQSPPLGPAPRSENQGQPAASTSGLWGHGEPLSERRAPIVHTFERN